MGARLPAEGELERVVNAALNGFFQDIHRWISDALAVWHAGGCFCEVSLLKLKTTTSFLKRKGNLPVSPLVGVTDPASGASEVFQARRTALTQSLPRFSAGAR